MKMELPILSPRTKPPAATPPYPHALPEPPLHHAPPHIRHLIDSFSRPIRDLRISITDRCNFRCVYCMEPDARFLPHTDLLSPAHFARLAQISTSLGIRKIRLTGGEPTLRPDLPDIIRLIHTSAQPDEIALTTNGSLCTTDNLLSWKSAGLSRITFSLDAIDQPLFAATTRSNSSAADVIAAIRRAHAAGFSHLKLNAVIVRGLNDSQILPLAHLALDLNIAVRYIEYMPLDEAHAWNRDKLVPASEILSTIQSRFPLTPLHSLDPSSTSENFAFADQPRHAPNASIGVIAPVTRSFCNRCSRLRITAEGKVRPCLFSINEWSLRDLLFNHPHTPETDALIAQRLIDICWSKQAGHTINADSFQQPPRPMSAIGG
jgi:cyclic pyranopterin phosphate synthase